MPNTIYQEEIRRWRDRMEAGLRGEDGWLTLIGLFWLEEGENQFGSAAQNTIVLPSAAAPAHAGSFVLHGGTVTLRVATDTPLTVDGRPAGMAQVLRADGAPPSLVAIGSVTMFVIRRGDRYAIRARDRNHPARAAFAGRQWFPIDPSYRLTATFVPHEPPNTLPILNVLGTVEERASPGYLAFTLAEQEYRLDALVEEDQLFIIFRDQTSGESTYGAGRYLKTALPENGAVTLDFNRAYSPPCAFTEFATCPLPPPQNRLPLRIEAGELYGHHDQIEHPHG